MSGIVGSRLNNRGSGVVGSIGTDGQVLTSTGAGLTQGFEAAPSGGITHADLYRVNANAALSDGTNVITANWISDIKSSSNIIYSKGNILLIYQLW